MFGWFGKFSKKSMSSTSENANQNLPLGGVTTEDSLTESGRNDLETRRKKLEERRREAAKSSMAWYFDIEMEDLLRHFFSENSSVGLINDLLRGNLTSNWVSTIDRNTEHKLYPVNLGD